MKDVRAIIRLDQRGSGFLLNGIVEGIIKRLQAGFNCHVVVGEHAKNSKFINGVINVEIPVILKNVESTTTQKLEEVLTGLLDGYDKYTNLRVQIIE